MGINHHELKSKDIEEINLREYNLIEDTSFRYENKFPLVGFALEPLINWSNWYLQRKLHNH